MMSFKDIIGQDNAVNLLVEQLKNRRVSHAFLFIGKDGVGKKRLALEFARALFCPEKEADACGICLSCKKVVHQNHPDIRLIEIDEGDNIKIEQIRELQQEIAYKPYESDRKVFIIDQADQMTVQAANSLLKTLEEPPSYAIIILLAEGTDSLLPTVISRCQKIQLNKLPREEIEKKLKLEGIRADRAEVIAGLVDGSLGRALSLLGDEEFLNNRQEVYSILYNLDKVDTVDLFKQADKLTSYLDNGLPLFKLILSLFRDIILYKQGNNNRIVNFDLIDYIKVMGKKYKIEELIGIVNLTNTISGYIRANVKKDLALQNLLLKIRAKRV